MFGGSRRHRQANQPLTAATANPSAATAAASAFARRASSSSLSSAAAAAALRARPTTPINVAEVQTKRTQKRSASVSSHGSQDTRRSLHRSPSQGSMSERTFRSPSPHRTPAPAEDAPPVPTIPDDVRSNGGRSAHTRSTSLQMQPFRVASQKQKEGGSWFGAATEGNLANVRTSDAPMRVASPESRPGAVSPTSSVNFSYPRGLHTASPPPSPAVESIRMTSSQRLASPRRTESVASRSSVSEQPLVYDPNSRRMVPNVNLLAKEQSVRDASEKSPKKKRHQQQGLARSGSHLAKGTMGRTHGVAVESDEPGASQRKQPQAQAHATTPEPEGSQTQHLASETAQPVPASTHVEQQVSKDRHHSPPNGSAPETRSQRHSTASPEITQAAPEVELEQATQDVRKSEGATNIPRSEPRQGVPKLARKPSTVQEESDEDLLNSEDEDDQEPAAQQDVANVLDAVPVRSSGPPKQPSLSSESTVVESQVSASQRQPSPPELRQHGSVRNARAHSSSPARSARFALGADQLLIRHEPPARSVSPRKSALKHSTSPSRGASPTDESSEASGPSRYGSEAAAVEAPVAHRKSVRVSFDDENTKVVGQSAAKPELDSPVPPSPQTKRHWYSHLGRNRKKDAISLDDDEVMKPRPALPSFGSVRDKKLREPEERPLVRPVEPPSSPSAHDTSATYDSDNEEHSAPLGAASDHNVGAILNQEQTARNAANISRFREPLPPVVTSMEGNGYYSSSSSSSEDEEEHEIVKEPEPTLPPEQVKEEIVASHPEMTHDGPVSLTALVDQKQPEGKHEVEHVPAISVIQPTPTPKEAAPNGSVNVSGSGYFDVPGGFPEDESDDNAATNQARSESMDPKKTVDEQAPAPRTERAIAFAPSAQKTTYAPLVEETESSEGDSIYSDAYEDLSEVEGDGFMSLDAVITTPIPNKVSQKLYEKVLVTPPKDSSKDSQASDSPPGPEPIRAAGQPEDEWEKAKQYWRGLTSDKRRQLEKGAFEEAGVEGDLEEVIQPKKVRRKKSVRRSEGAAEEQAATNPERVYQIQPGTKAADEEDDPPSPMRKTLRGRQPQETNVSGKLQKTMRGGQPQQASFGGMGMRKTLRSDTSTSSQPVDQQQLGGGGMRKSMRQNGSSAGAGPQPRAGAAPASRPLSIQGPPRRESDEKRSKHASIDGSMTSTEMAKAMQANLRRRASDSSESSFRRSRPRRDGLGFRKSMRSNDVPESGATGRNSRFSLRSASPPGSPRSPPITMGNRMTMRTMRRDSSESSTKRLSLLSFGGKKSAKETTKPGKKSRFGDSSDDDDAGPSAFRSRFADSSDEDERQPSKSASQAMPKTMRTSSSAAAAAMKMPPPRYDEKAEESPDLPDSSDEEVAPPPVQPQKPLSPRKISGASGRLVKSQSDGHGLQRSGSGRGALMESSTTPAVGTQVMARPTQHRRGSLLSVLRRKKDTDMGKISRPSHGESGARMDTKLERSPDEISALRSGTISPRLQKQMENWPLVEETIDDEKRPMTSDGTKPMDASRPVFAPRRSTNQVLTAGRPGELDTTQLEGTRKKKKFGMLRRMFKLDD
ncbi:hypothetical protein CKAH01_00459 [Colletotrichum kahawae]|uniref:Uncharacterized protein n=1 Tax=Colletotrichum kahawae TaxID=34407 RepID=A0AAD9YV66_COLKA|nr:hypothetical protein CKAH01_00459 [Colletotrichum kahawae]